MPSLSTPMSYHRLMKLPLDDTEIFTNLRDLMDYCNNGACYDGQKVVVLNDELKAFEYTINKNVPIINLKGSEPIFRNITFNGDSTSSYGMLIYYCNGASMWYARDVFSYEENKLCLFNQLEIFRILDASNNKTFKFYMERTERNTNTVSTYYWNQTYNPYDDRADHTISQSSGAEITEILFTNHGFDSFIITNNSDIHIMPKTIETNDAEQNIITKIYIKAEDYHYALI